MAVVDVLDDALMAQLCAAQSRAEAPTVARGEFAIDEQPEPFIGGQGIDVGKGELLRIGLCHAGKTQLVQLIERGMCEHGGGLLVGQW